MVSFLPQCLLLDSRAVYFCEFLPTFLTTAFWFLLLILPLFPGYLSVWMPQDLVLESLFFSIYVYLFSFIFISWRLITLQYCSGFCHTLTWINHGFLGDYMKFHDWLMATKFMPLACISPLDSQTSVSNFLMCPNLVYVRLSFWQFFWLNGDCYNLLIMVNNNTFLCCSSHNFAYSSILCSTSNLSGNSVISSSLGMWKTLHWMTLFMSYFIINS